MKRIRALNLYQKGILIAMVLMAIVFAVIYPKVISRVGVEYQGTILVPEQDGSSTVYSGRIKGEIASFTVLDQYRVTYQYGDKSYGTYTVKEDPTALSEMFSIGGSKGIEIRNGDTIVFRGSVTDMGDSYWLHSEDDSFNDIARVTYVDSFGVERDTNGNPIDQMEPKADIIYELAMGPKLTHKGAAGAWFAAVVISILNLLVMLFADELFRFRLMFVINYAQDAEPSDWEIAGRYVSWTALTVMIFAIYVIGLL